MPAPLANADLLSDPRRAGARAHFQAMGLDERDLSKPLVGIATTWTGTMPCNLGQRDLAQHVAAGVRAAGGTPIEFNTIAISDNLTQGMPAMRASLVSREVIADSIELVGREPALRRADLHRRLRQDRAGRGDGAGAARRAGAHPLLGRDGRRLAPRRAGDDPGRLGGGRRARGGTDRATRSSRELERDACPGIGSCTGHFTANTMAVAVDFLGLGPVGLGRDHGDRSGEAGGGRGRPGASCST